MNRQTDEHEHMLGPFVLLIRYEDNGVGYWEFAINIIIGVY